MRVPGHRGACAVLLLVASAAAQTLHWSERRLWPVQPDAAVAHPVPGRLLLLEQSALGELMTWTGVGADWIGRPDQAPPSRTGYSLCLDTLRRRVLLVGGRGPSQPDTWAYDGHRWQQLPTATTPASFGAGIAYDARRDRVVLHGGELAPSSLQFSDQTHEFDGVHWSLVANTPGLDRIGVGLAYDAARGRTVLFGGTTPAPPPQGGLPQQDTWEWNGVVWTQVVTTQAPGRRGGFGFAFDAARARIVLHGGLERMPPSPVVFTRTDTWEFDGTNWSQVAPALGYSGMLVPDEATGSLAMLTVGLGGGVGVARTNRSGTAWQTPLPVPALPPVSEYLVYDSGRDRLVLHDNRTSSGAANTTWEWDGVAWSDRQPTVVPPSRDLGTFSFDPIRSRAVLFGGADATGTPLADTWLWDGVVWTQTTPAASPPPRSAHAAAFDLGRQRLVLFGGRGPVGFLSDTWEWDGVIWRSVAAPAPARDSHVMAFDPVRGRTVVHGGFAGLGIDQETWEYDGAAWTRVGQNGPLTVFGSMVFDPITQRCVLTDPGVPFGPYLPRTWSWDGVSWQAVAVAQPGPGWKLAFDSARRQIVSSAGVRHYALTASPAATARYGSGCAGSGTVLQLDVGQRPVLGNRDFRLEVADALPQALCGLFAGFAQVNTPLGAGCSLLVASPQTLGFVLADGAGIASFGLAVPDTAVLLGVRFYAQGAAIDVAGAFGVVTTSNGQDVLLGR